MQVTVVSCIKGTDKPPSLLTGLCGVCIQTTETKLQSILMEKGYQEKMLSIDRWLRRCENGKLRLSVLAPVSCEGKLILSWLLAHELKRVSVCRYHNYSSVSDCHVQTCCCCHTRTTHLYFLKRKLPSWGRSSEQKWGSWFYHCKYYYWQRIWSMMRFQDVLEVGVFVKR